MEVHHESNGDSEMVLYEKLVFQDLGNIDKNLSTKMTRRIYHHHGQSERVFC